MQKNQGLIHFQYKLAVFLLTSMGHLLFHPSSNFGSASFQYLGLSCTSLKTTLKSKASISGELGERHIFMYLHLDRTFRFTLIGLTYPYKGKSS